MKRLIVAGVLLLSTTIFGADTMLNETPYEIAKSDIGKGKAVMLEIGSDKCGSCQDMGKMLYRVKKSAPDAMIFFINVWQERKAIKILAIQMIPTQIIYDAKGKEVYRHIGPLTGEELGKALTQYKVR
ncbi:MAG: thioredoxin family protein [Thiovulaceae bacterium]|nr:thioredoxin family protein [Sulfurimonadaceae bacterium]